MSDDLVRLLAGSPVQPMEGAYQSESPNGLWGPKTSTRDADYYLPESLIGELPYRYQGVALHGLLSMLPLGRASQLYNGAYALGTHLAGRTAPVTRPEAQMPMPTYPMRNKLAESE